MYKDFFNACVTGNVETIRKTVTSLDKNLSFEEILHNVNFDSLCERRWDAENGLQLACAYNKSPGVVQFLIDEMNMNILTMNNYGTTIFMSVCKGNTLENVKYVANKILQINRSELFLTNNMGSDASTLACGHNTLDVIKYLVDELGFTCIAGTNGLLTACKYSLYPDVIRYLICDLHIDINSKNRYNQNGFYLACLNNPSIDIVRCLAEEFNFDTNIELSRDDKDTISDSENKKKFLIEQVFVANQNDDIIKYLIDNTNQIITIFRRTDFNASVFLHYLKNNAHPIIQLYDHTTSGYVLNIRRTYQYIINNKRYELLSYSPFVNPKLYLNILDYDLLVEICTHRQSYIHDIPKVLTDGMDRVTQKSYVLFKTPFNNTHLNIHDKSPHTDLKLSCVFNDECAIYYCSGWWICNVIPLFNKMIEFGGIESERDITLKLDFSKRIFDVYLMACCTGTLNISNFDVIDMLKLVLLMDMYPNVMFTLEDIETILITILDVDEDHVAEVLMICNRFKLKRLLIAQYDKFINNQ